MYVLGHVHVLPPGQEDPEIEPNNWRWLDLIDHLKIKVCYKLLLRNFNEILDERFEMYLNIL